MSKTALSLLVLWSFATLALVCAVVRDVNHAAGMERRIKELKVVVEQQRLALQRYAGLEKGIKMLQDNLIREAQIADNCLEELGRKGSGAVVPDKDATGP